MGRCACAGVRVIECYCVSVQWGRQGGADTPLEQTQPQEQEARAEVAEVKVLELEFELASFP